MLKIDRFSRFANNFVSGLGALSLALNEYDAYPESDSEDRVKSSTASKLVGVSMLNNRLRNTIRDGLPINEQLLDEIFKEVSLNIIEDHINDVLDSRSGNRTPELISERDEEQWNRGRDQRSARLRKNKR